MSLKRVKKAWEFLRYFLCAEKIWRSPVKSDLLIFDATGQEEMIEYLRQWTPEVLHVFGEKINLPVLLASLFKRGKRIDAYVDCFIERVRPRLVITYIDNSPVFYSITSRNPNVKSMFIQNGSRAAELFESLPQEGEIAKHRHVDYMMVFGDHIGAKYARFVNGRALTIGSLRNNLFRRRATLKKGTIAFVSQFRDMPGFICGGRYCSREEFFGQVDQLVLPFLLNYADSHDKRLVIIPNVELDGLNPVAIKEQDYYRRLLGQTFTFSERRGPAGGYDSTDAAEVVVSIDSSLGYESAARGNKTAFLPIRGTLLGMPDRNFGWPGQYPDEGPFWTNRASPAAFTRILDHLFALDDRQWKQELSTCEFAKILAYDPGNSVLQSVLAEAMGPEPELKN